MQKIFHILLILVCVFRAVSCIAEEARKQNINELIGNLKNDKREIWHQAALSLARLEENIVFPLAEAVRARDIDPFRVGQVYENLNHPGSRENLKILLIDDDIRISAIAATALLKHGDHSAAPALATALKQFRQLCSGCTEKGREDYHAILELATALGQLGDKEYASQEIITLARTYEGNDKYQLLEIIDHPIGRHFMQPEERLMYLVEFKIPMKVGGPNTLEIDLASKSQNKQLLPDADDRKFMERYRSRIIHHMRAQLGKTKSSAAALTLGYFKDRPSLDKLSRLFIESDDFYGWESSLPDELDHNQFPVLHAYEEAIKSITGKPIEKVINLAEKDTFELMARYRQGSSTALYVLFRLKYQVALEEVSRQFQRLMPSERTVPCILLATYFLQKGFSKMKVKNMLGAPENIQQHYWRYQCGESRLDSPLYLEIIFKQGRVTHFRLKTD